MLIVFAESPCEVYRSVPECFRGTLLVVPPGVLLQARIAGMPRGLRSCVFAQIIRKALKRSVLFLCLLMYIGRCSMEA